MHPKSIRPDPEKGARGAPRRAGSRIALVGVQATTAGVAAIAASMAPEAAGAITILAVAAIAVAGLVAERMRDHPGAPVPHGVDTLLLREVLPVWQRQLEATRVLAERTTDDTLGTFGAIAEGLERSIAAPSATPARDEQRALRDQVDRALVTFQAQDRISQMLATITADIDRMNDLLSGDGDRARPAAAQWLERLDASYTMPEQRSLHHDQPAATRSHGVEYF